MAAAVTGMLAWVVGVALIPLDAKLDNGPSIWPRCCGRTRASCMRPRCWRSWARCCWRIIRRAHPPGPRGLPGRGLLRVSLAGCVITQTPAARRREFRAGSRACRGRKRQGRAGHVRLARAVADFLAPPALAWRDSGFSQEAVRGSVRRHVGLDRTRIRGSARRCSPAAQANRQATGDS